MTNKDDEGIEDERKNPSITSCPQKCTISEVIDAIGYGKYQVQLSLVAGLAFLTDAMEMMILSVIAPALECSDWNVTPTQVASLTTFVFVAMMITSPIWGWISDAYGRRRSLIISSVILFLLGLTTAFSPTFTWLIVLRFMCGCCISCMPQCVTILLEYLPSNARGKANLVMTMIWAFGGSFTVLIAWGCIPNWLYGWRLLIASCTAPILVFLVFSFWMPESILFLSKIGKQEEAKLILKSIAKANRKQNVLEEKEIIFNQNDEKSNLNKGIDTLSVMNHLFGQEKKKLTFLIWSICALAGFNYYGVVLFATEIMAEDNENITNLNSNSSGCHVLEPRDYRNLFLTSLAEFPATIISLWIMDIIGRKKTFLINSAIYSIVLCIILTLGPYLDGTGITVLLFLARGTGVSYAWTLFIYVPEAYPTEVRSIGFGLGSAFIRIGGMITPYFAQVLLGYSKHLALSVYAMMGVLGCILPMCLPIETMGLDLSMSESSKLLKEEKTTHDDSSAKNEINK